jgi:hypothetical protein
MDPVLNLCLVAALLVCAYIYFAAIFRIMWREYSTYRQYRQSGLVNTVSLSAVILNILILFQSPLLKNFFVFSTDTKRNSCRNAADL